MNERQAAVAELDLCQQALDTISGRTWQSTGIILAGEIAAVALMTQLEASLSKRLS